MKKIISVLLLAVFSSMVILPANAGTFVNAGRKIPVVYSGEKTSGKNLTSGDKIHAQVKSDIIVNNTIVFKQGAPVILNVADAKKAKCWGAPGELYLVNGTVEDIKGIYHPIEYNYKITGNERNWPKVLGCVSIFFLFPLALFGFVHGGQAELIPGKTINATLLNDFTL